MNELRKFSISILIFSIIFPLVLYLKINKYVACIAFVILFFVSAISFLSKTFAQNLKRYLKKNSEFLGHKLATITLFLIYIFAIIPTKLFTVVFKRDRLKIKENMEETYWLEAKEERPNWDLQY